MSPVSKSDIETYQRDGVVVLRGLFADHVADLRQGIALNMSQPGPYASNNDRAGETGRFFDDYCNWQRIDAFQRVMRDPEIMTVAADLMRSHRVQMFHDHVLVKEPGTSMATPWHSDAPYYFVEGHQTLSFWVPLDPVDQASLRCVPGSHLWEKDVLPTRWAKGDAFFDPAPYMPVPDPDAEGLPTVEYQMVPGDAVAFHFRTLHGARGNLSEARRRAFSLRLIGDDARYTPRPGPTSPPFPGHDMRPGDSLREDWFPILYERAT